MADYVNNKEFYAEMVIYHAAYKQSLIEHTDKPQLSNKAASAIIQIAHRMMNSYNFSRYTWKDEMAADAILKCYEKIHTFDPERSQNPFAWASQCIWNAAIHRIKKENHQSSVKAKLIREKMSAEFVEHGVDFDENDGSNSFVNFLLENDAYVDYHEETRLRLEREKIDPPKPSITHRNKTPYKKKEVTPKVIHEPVTLDALFI